MIVLCDIQWPMRALFYIIFIATIALSGAAFTLWQLGWNGQDSVLSPDLEVLIDEALAEYPVAMEVEAFPSLQQSDQERLSLENYLPNSLAYTKVDLASLIRFAKSCDPHDKVESSDQNLGKAIRLAEIICGLAPIPNKFFENPPYIHPLGRSYVERAYRSGKPKFNRPFLKQNRDFLHAIEFHHHFPQESHYLGLLSTLNGFQRRSWSESLPIFIDQQRIWRLTRNHSERTPMSAGYKIYDLAPVNQWFAFKGLQLGPPSAKKKCLNDSSGFCLHVDQVGELVRKWAFNTLVSAAVIVLVGLIFMVALWSLARRRSQKERLMILKTLAHELRTPVTSMRLGIEALRTEFDRLSPEGQSSYLQMASDLRRLKRLVESSSTYLGSDSSNRYAKEKVELNRLLDSFVKDQAIEIEYQPAPKPIFIKSHPYWLTICLKNLVENAHKHGEPPISLSIDPQQDRVVIRVQDGGSISARDLKRFSREFRKGPKSNGMGLGLAIVTDTMDKLGHKFEFHASPTRFLITLEKVP
jgi:hypothetical protein